jgi:hypothetical protein
MTDTTPRTGAPLLAAAQAQKHVTHNEALYQFDAFLCARFLDRDLTAPPSSPSDGDSYLVKATATGDWAGQDAKIAYCADGDWRFYAPFGGLVAYVADESKLIAYTGSAWVDYASLIVLQNVPLLGVNTTASSPNLLAVESNAVLFTDVPTGSGGTGDIRATLSKQASTNTASFLFQDAFSGRAEVGLTGDDNFHFKVSPDGATWHDALVLTASSGQATIAAAHITGGSVDGTAIGSSTPSSGAFTTLSASAAATLSPASANVTLSPSGTGTVTINPATAGAMNNVALGATTPASGAFTTLSASAAATLSPASANVTLSPSGTGTVTINPATAGAMNNVVLGATTPQPATVTGFASNAIKDSKTSAATTLQIDNVGRVLVGPTGSFSTALSVAGTAAGFQIASVNGSANLNTVRFTASAASGGALSLAHSRATTIGSFATLSAGDQLGVLNFAGDDGTTYNTIGAQIRGLAISGGAISTGVIPGQIVLAAMNAAGTLTDLAKIDATSGLSAVTQLSTPKVSSNAASALDLQTSGGTQFEVAHTASSVNFLQATGSATGAGTATLAAAGTDSNIDIVLTAKGTGAVRIATVANGAVATALSSVGPTGSHATVQEWFAVKNASGVVRYIPAF